MSQLLLNLEIANLQDFETRDLKKPDGTVQRVDLPRLYWNFFDRLHARSGQHFLDVLFGEWIPGEMEEGETGIEQVIMRIMEDLVQDELDKGRDPFDTPEQRFYRRKVRRQISEKLGRDQDA